MDKTYLKNKDDVNMKIFIDRNFFMELILSADVESALLIDYIIKKTSETLDVHIEKLKLREIYMFGSFRIDDKKDILFQNNISRITQAVHSFAPIIDYKMPNKTVGHGLRESGVDNLFLAQTIYAMDGPVKSDVSIFITGDTDLVMLPNFISNKTVPVLVRFNIPEINRFTSNELAQNFTYVINTFSDLKRFKYVFDGKPKKGRVLSINNSTGFISSPEKLAFKFKKDPLTGKDIDNPNFYFYKDSISNSKELAKNDFANYMVKFLYNVHEQKYHFCAYDVKKA